jgi:hypothetical protein
MRRKYLGDSYDLVKRFWADSLRSVARLYAHPRFIPEEIRAEYELLTRIPVGNLHRLRPPYGLLLDPHTGIPLPSQRSREVTIAYAPLSFVVSTMEEFNPGYMICFDQSHTRSHRLTPHAQRQRKMAFLRERGFHSIYYRSHAPFLFVTRFRRTMDCIVSTMASRGIPGCRLET